MESSPLQTVNLTFDDGPDPVWTPRVLDALAESGTKAAFFVIAPLALEYPRLVERALEEGHEIGLHCEMHIRHTELSEREIFEDARRGLEALGGLGVSPTGWRPPWGIVTDATKRVAEELRLTLTLWTLDTHDWRGDSSDEMLRAITPNLTGEAVILMHDGLGPGARRNGCRETVALIPALANRLEDVGFESADSVKTPLNAAPPVSAVPDKGTSTT